MGKVKIKTDDGTYKEFMTDYKICDNIYYTENKIKIDKNINQFDINVHKNTQEPNGLGLRYSKREDMVIVTYHLVDNYGKDQIRQFLVNSKSDISKFKSVDNIGGLREILTEGISISKIKTLGELMENTK